MPPTSRSGGLYIYCMDGSTGADMSRTSMNSQDSEGKVHFALYKDAPRIICTLLTDQ